MKADYQTLNSELYLTYLSLYKVYWCIAIKSEH
jgi:hypothetical protein